ncbi:alpha/beta fold hydrolase [Spirosoma endbachense]|uniref:Alpha/beta fold hydrolase n=1 Tax=Spirosoma endbachense TaxID=2666025 RepID=A0A6P1VMC8_9BACT|nr:alpha/beta fold hydrolase [Spirosoma endbachense]QHV93734.1 alpha/beta fold hydrolase [Spirosoma endbachense]
MKKFLFIFAITFTTACFGQTHQPRTFLLVHGAWSGGWDYAKVDAILSAKGDIVYRPTLTGLGERVHLSNAKINLSTYIADIVNVIKFEDLHNIILMGHSFGGMVISGVAEQVPDRISQLIYLDAMVPNNGESAQAVCGDLWNVLIAPNIKDSLVLYPFGSTKPTPPTDVPQPLKTYTESLKLNNPLVKKIPTAYIVMTKNGKSDSATDKMGVNRARARNWKVYNFEGGHYSMREQPYNLVKKLELILQNEQ